MFKKTIIIIHKHIINKFIKLTTIIKRVRLIITIKPIIKFINLSNDIININIIVNGTNENIRLSNIFSTVSTIVIVKSELV